MTRRRSVKLETLVALVAVAVAACATGKGTRPHQMSVAEHDDAAQREADAARHHDGQYDSEAWSTGTGGCSAYCFDT